MVFNTGSGGYSEAARHVQAEQLERQDDARRRNRGRLSQDDNEAHAPGKICELCGSPITEGQDARLRADGWWIHEACPVQ